MVKHRVESDGRSTAEKPLARVLFHPGLKNAAVAAAQSKEATGGLVHRHRVDGESWLLAEEELFNGCILEMRLGAPAVWLQVRIEGLPGNPSACVHLLDGSPIRLPLCPGTRLRWPREGIDRSLFRQVLDTPAVDTGSHVRRSQPPRSWPPRSSPHRS